MPRFVSEREVRLRGVQRMELEPTHADLRLVQRASRPRRPGHGRDVRIERVAEPEAEVLERIGDAILRTEHIVRVDEPVRGAWASTR